MYKTKSTAQGQSKEILDYVLPYCDRRNFDPKVKELPDNITFDITCFFRFFRNPKLVNYSQSSLHQYHILFNLLESELRFMQTDMQGIELKIVLFSPITTANMQKFIK
mgnify:CR=1 FL=1